MEGEGTRMARETTLSCECWEVDVDPAEIERLLQGARKESPEAIIQAFSASRTPNGAAVEMIAAQTLTAARSGSTLAERPELDLLLRLAGTRQIGEAFKRVGYKSSGKRLFMVAASVAGEGLKSMRTRASGDRRFALVAKRRLGKVDLDLVERAALLAARL
jgi:tRNA threonylcarbamoyladenosine modification (KEOPS) complex Cgi121 subunit